MTDADRTPQDDPVAQIVSALAANGFPRMPASVLMALMVSEARALTAEQLSAQLSASPAAISGAVRYLSTVGVIHRHRQPGQRHYVYELPSHPWYTVSLGQNDLYGQLVRLSEAAAESLGPQASERVREMADFFRFLRTRLPEVLEEWNEQRSVPAAPPPVE